jgi:hypothetical protein
MFVAQRRCQCIIPGYPKEDNHCRIHKTEDGNISGQRSDGSHRRILSKSQNFILNHPGIIDVQSQKQCDYILEFLSRPPVFLCELS